MTQRVVPFLGYEDAAAAIEWLEHAFGFTEDREARYEEDDVITHAEAKRARKGCDWIVANDVSGDVMGGTENAVHIVTAEGVEAWPRMPKDEVARRLAARIAAVFA